jgi:hypothetical protein
MLTLVIIAYKVSCFTNKQGMPMRRPISILPHCQTISVSYSYSSTLQIIIVLRFYCSEET